MTTSKKNALHKAKYGKLRKIGKQIYHRNNRVYTGKGPKGSGHQAGESWGEQKQIDPNSTTRKYSKRSPSFDQGVNNYKVRAHNKAISNAKLDKFIGKI